MTDKPTVTPPEHEHMYFGDPPRCELCGIEREYHYVAGLRLEGRSEADLTEIAMRTADLRGERIAELEAEIKRLRLDAARTDSLDLRDAAKAVLDHAPVPPDAPRQWWFAAEGPEEEMVCGRCDQRIPNGTPATYVLAHADRCPTPAETGLREALEGLLRGIEHEAVGHRGPWSDFLAAKIVAALAALESPREER